MPSMETAVALVVRPHDNELVKDLSFVLIGLFSVALSRAWQLVQSMVAAAMMSDDRAISDILARARLDIDASRLTGPVRQAEAG